MPPKPSTSKLAPAKAAVPAKKPAANTKPPAATAAKKLTDQEKQVYEIGKAQNDGIITQEVLMHALRIDQMDADLANTINNLAKKRLFVSMQTASGDAFWKVQTPVEAKSSATVSDESAIVLELVRTAGDRGIWTKIIKTKSGLHQTIINKCISQLEGQKKIKNVKSVKYPTRKIYMLEGITPSIELTGGPWYTDNDLDTEFIERISLLCHKFVKELAGTSGADSDKLFPIAHTPYLPTAHDVAEKLKAAKVLSGLDLNAAHIEQILKILVLDGDLQIIKVTRMEGDYDSDPVDEEGDEANSSKKRKRKSGSGKNAKKPKMEGDDSDAIDQESEMDDFIEEDDNDDQGSAAYKDAEDDLPPPLDEATGKPIPVKRRPGPPNRWKHFNVYRPLTKAIVDIPFKVGYTDTPCGVCPVASECDNKDKPSMPDRSLADVDSLIGVGVTVQKRRTRADEDDEALLRMKPPNGLFEPVKVWMGGGTRGKQRVGLVNPRECEYYGNWLSY